MPDKADVHTKPAMNSGAIDAEEDAIRDGCPGWIFWITIETHLETKLNKFQRKDQNTRVKDLNPVLQNSQQFNLQTEFKINLKEEKKWGKTLFSDLDLSFLKTAFLSAKLSEAITDSETNNQNDKGDNLRGALLFKHL